MNRRVVSLVNDQGHPLHCVFEEPAGERERGIVAILLPPGVKTRVGPHRINRKLAQAFLSRGIPVLRTDFAGLGDSGGEIADSRLEAMYRSVQLGGNIGDTRAALDWAERELGVRRCVVGGLCGAAITALLAAQDDERIAALYAIALPVTLEKDVGRDAAQMTPGELRSYRATYLRKLLRPEAWLRLLSMKTDYRLLWRSLAQPLTRRFSSGALPEGAPASDVSQKFTAAFFALVGSGRPALLMYGEHDHLLHQYEEKFAKPWAKSVEPFAPLVTKVVIPGGNHILGDPASVAEAVRATRDWLDNEVLAESRLQAKPMLRRLAHVAGRFRPAPAA